MSDLQANPSREPPYAITYSFTFPDYQAFRRARRSLNRFDNALWRWRYAWVMGIALAVLAFSIWDHAFTSADVVSWDYLGTIGPLLLGLMVFVAVVDILFDRILARRMFRRYAMAGKTLSVAFTDAGIDWSSDGFEGHFDWAKVTRLVTFKDYLFLFISKIEALGVSRRAMRPQSAFEGLVQFAKERVNGQAL